MSKIIFQDMPNLIKIGHFLSKIWKNTGGYHGMPQKACEDIFYTRWHIKMAHFKKLTRDVKFNFSRSTLRIFIGTLKRPLYTTQHDIFRLIRFKAFSTLHWKILILKSLSTWIGMKIFRMREKSWNFLNEIFEYF